MKKMTLILMGLCLAAGLRTGFGDAPVVVTSAPATQAGARIEFTSPKEWQVFQVAADDGAVMRVSGKVEIAEAKGLHFRTEVHGLDNRRHVRSDFPTTDWNADGGGGLSLNAGFHELGAESYMTGFHFGSETLALPKVSIHDGTFHEELKLPAGGWYSVKVEIVAENDRVVASAVVPHVGAGEVFVVGGQSNSTNWGEVKTKSESGMVTVFDGKEWTVAADPLPGVDAGQGKGSPWCTFGDLMYKRLGVPIGIVPVGKGSTSVRQWLPEGDVVEIEPTKTYGLKKNSDGKWVSEGTLYDRMVDRMKELGPKGFRAMLWHQGESDAHQGAGHTLPGKDYRETLERVIGKSRQAVGWEVPWFVATATWGSPQSPEDPDIRAAQEGVIVDGFAMRGPDTDQLTGEYRQKNGTGVHMSEKGLRAHGGLWTEVVGKWIDSSAKTQP